MINCPLKSLWKSVFCLKIMKVRFAGCLRLIVSPWLGWGGLWVVLLKGRLINSWMNEWKYALCSVHIARKRRSDSLNTSYKGTTSESHRSASFADGNTHTRALARTHTYTHTYTHIHTRARAHTHTHNYIHTKYPKRRNRGRGKDARRMRTIQKTKTVETAMKMSSDQWCSQDKFVGLDFRGFRWIWSYISTFYALITFMHLFGRFEPWITPPPNTLIRYLVSFQDCKILG